MRLSGREIEIWSLSEDSDLSLFEHSLHRLEHLVLMVPDGMWLDMTRTDTPSKQAKSRRGRAGRPFAKFFLSTRSNSLDLGKAHPDRLAVSRWKLILAGSPADVSHHADLCGLCNPQRIHHAATCAPTGHGFDRSMY